MKKRPWIVLLSLAAACPGANLNERVAGNPDGGTAIATGEIAVARSGRFFLVRDDDTLSLGNIEQKSLSPLGLQKVDTLAFWPEEMGEGFFAISFGKATSGDGQYGSLRSYSLSERKVLWTQALRADDRKLDVSKDGKYVVVYGSEVSIRSAETGAEVGHLKPSNGIVDVDLTKDSAQVIVTEATEWSGDDADENALPVTRVTSLQMSDAKVLCTLEATNCASELVVDAEGKQAYIAPSFCRRDPVTVLDLAGCRVRQTLPGFGPIALTADGTTGIAFIDNTREDPLAPPLPQAVKDSATRYHLMLFSTEDLSYRTLPVGGLAPRYALTPNGKHIVLDGVFTEQRGDQTITDSALRIVTVEDGAIRKVDHEALLQAYVMTPDSASAWYLWTGLFELDIAAATATELAMDQSVQALNITPAGDYLLLRVGDSQSSSITLYDLNARAMSPLRVATGS